MRLSVPLAFDGPGPRSSTVGTATSPSPSVTLQSGYMLIRHVQRGHGTNARTKPRRNAAAGLAMTYPALIVRVRNGMETIDA
jgi:hypothetical protein